MSFLTGKTAIITGAGRAVLSDGRCGSIGYGIAAAYAKEGANLTITGRNMQKLEAAKAAAYALGVSEGIDPFMTLSFMALPVIPSLRITTRGVFDVNSQRYV